jgi:hypothetical protein
MTSTTATTATSDAVRLSRLLLLALAAVFVAGALGQFFLAGLSVFDSPVSWTDHRRLGHGLGVIAHVAWIPAAIGRTGGRIVAGTAALAVLFEAQYGFVQIDEPAVQALHPLNGAVMFALALWVGARTFALVRNAA